MKTLIGTVLALGLLSTAASAQWCPPGGHGYGQRHASYGHTLHRPAQSVAQTVVEQAPEAAAPAAPIEPAPLPEQQSAPEAVPPK